MSTTGKNLLMMAVLAAGSVGGVAAQSAAPACAQPVAVHGFQTCANVDAALKESLVVYSSDPDLVSSKMLAEFNRMFPTIKTGYVRAQAGALYARLMAEQRAGTFAADVVSFNDAALVLDLMERKGLARYLSPEMAAYSGSAKSQPEGYWTTGSVNSCGIAYNPAFVKPEDAPKSWGDIVKNPAWANAINLKSTNAFMSRSTWWAMKQRYGDQYWTEFAKLKPRGFDSYVQQYDRLINGQDKIAACAQYNAFVEYTAKGAKLAFVVPEEGMPASPVSWGVLEKAPNPNAARLFLDWYLSAAGQKFINVGLFFKTSPRSDVEPPAGSLSTDAQRWLYPAEIASSRKVRDQYVKEWDSLLGLR